MVPAVVVTTMETVANDLTMDPAAPMLLAPVLAKMVPVPVPVVPAAPVDSAGTSLPASAVDIMAAAAFDMAVVPSAPVLPDPEPAILVALPVAPTALTAIVAPAAPAVGTSSIHAMVHNKKR